MGNQVGWGDVSEIYAQLFTTLFIKQSLGGIVKKNCLIFHEQDHSPKTNLKMFKFDNKLISKKNTCSRNDWGA